MILIITNKEDVHPNRVINHLNIMGEKVFRLNTDHLLNDYSFTWRSEGKQITYNIVNLNSGLVVEGESIKSIWERRPVKPTANSSDFSKVYIDEGIGFLDFFRGYISNKFSIGSILYDDIASSKMLQLEIAHALGMDTPATIFSNDLIEIKLFAENYSGLAIKSIDTDSLYIDNSEYVFYTRMVDKKDIRKLNIENHLPTFSFFQEYIQKKFEVRVTVVCNDVFACSINSQELDFDTGKIDWRQGYEHGLICVPIDIPDSVKSFCRSFLKENHLNFGCFDFIVTPDNDYVFLECNPNGQWLWVEEMTGLDISRTIAETLQRACW